VYLFGINLGGLLWTRQWTHTTTTWGAWTPLSGVLQTGPVAVTVGSQVYVFGLNSVGNTWYRAWNGSSFGAWQNLGGILAWECAGRATVAAWAGEPAWIRVFLTTVCRPAIGLSP
jgi:hypothetical protein